MIARAMSITLGRREKGMKNSLTLRMHCVLVCLPGNLRALGPYVLVALIVPGGLLLAPLLWLSSHKQARA
jgi:hypothetical protein